MRPINGAHGVTEDGEGLPAGKVRSGTMSEKVEFKPEGGLGKGVRGEQWHVSTLLMPYVRWLSPATRWERARGRAAQWHRQSPRQSPSAGRAGWAEGRTADLGWGPAREFKREGEVDDSR